MKIILLQDVKKHGKKGEIIDVADGFGKNYLIKNKLGVLADTAGLKKLNTEKKKEKEIDDQNRKEAQNTKEKLEKLGHVVELPNSYFNSPAFDTSPDLSPYVWYNLSNISLLARLWQLPPSIISLTNFLFTLAWV